jgi:hypothetical protein
MQEAQKTDHTVGGKAIARGRISTWPGHLASSLRSRPGHTAPTARSRRQRTQLERLQEGPHLGEGAAEHPVEVAAHAGDEMGVYRGLLPREALDGRD